LLSAQDNYLRYLDCRCCLTTLRCCPVRHAALFVLVPVSVLPTSPRSPFPYKRHSPEAIGLSQQGRRGGATIFCESKVFMKDERRTESIVSETGTKQFASDGWKRNHTFR